MAKHYQYIIIGAGCAGLQLAKALLQLPPAVVSSILIIDASKEHTEKTWCFWYSHNHPYKHLVKKAWQQIKFKTDAFSVIENISPKSYQLINSLDFFNDCISYFKADNRIEILYDTVVSLNQANKPIIITENTQLSCDYVFYTNPKLGTLSNTVPKIWQHFVGWMIETEQPIFNESVATIMDFSIDNSQWLSFVYVLPFSTTKALVECTLFSTTLQETAYYENILSHYIAENFTSNYKIVTKEYGRIPMQLPQNIISSNTIIPIGTAAGCIKASTGYSFVRALTHTQAIIAAINKHQSSAKPNFKPRFIFYDKLFLSIIAHQTSAMTKIFQQLFKHNTISMVLSFLDEKTNILQEAKIFLKLPKTPFLKALFRKDTIH